MDEGESLKMTKNMGVKVRLVTALSPEAQYLRNVTEIHYMHNPSDPSIAFESDIHATGMNIRLAAVMEFDARTETEIAEEY